MENRYDVIVVGAGNGGLAAAANTAKAGLKTLVLEKHNIPGGSATSFRRGRFEFEASLHELSNVGNEKDPDFVYKIFENVGAKINWCYEPDPYRAIVKGQLDARVRGGVQGYIDSIEEAVPGSRESVTKFLDLFKCINEAMEYMNSKNGKYNPLVMYLKYGDFIRVSSHTLTEVLDALNVPKKAQTIIAGYWGYLGVPADEVNCMFFLMMLMGYLEHGGAGMPHDRSIEMSLALSDVIHKNGGKIFYNAEVTEFLFDDNGRVCGVAVGDEKYYAKEVISNVIPHNVFNRSKIDKIPKSDLKLANAREISTSIFTIYIGLDCTAEELGIEDYSVFVMKDGDPRVQYEKRIDGGYYIVNCLNKVIPDCTPEGTCILFFSALMFGDDMPKDLKPEEYKKYKNDLAKKFIKDYEELTGMEITKHIEEISVATPVTFARYLGTPNGAIYAYRISKWDSIVYRIAFEEQEQKMKGLTFSGGHSAMGFGFSCTYMTGENTGLKVVKKLTEGGKN